MDEDVVKAIRKLFAQHGEYGYLMYFDKEQEELLASRKRLELLEEVVKPDAEWLRLATARVMQMEEADEMVWDILRDELKAALAAAMKEVPQ